MSMIGRWVYKQYIRAHLASADSRSGKEDAHLEHKEGGSLDILLQNIYFDEMNYYLIVYINQTHRKKQKFSSFHQTINDSHQKIERTNEVAIIS